MIILLMRPKEFSFLTTLVMISICVVVNVSPFCIYFVTSLFWKIVISLATHRLWKAIIKSAAVVIGALHIMLKLYFSKN